MSSIIRIASFALVGVLFAAGCAASSDDDNVGSGETGDEQDVRGLQKCGGIAGLKCGAGLTCVDDPIDSCDPANGGRDCGGICVSLKSAPKCGGIAGLTCQNGLKCVDNPSDACDPASGVDCGGVCVKAACDPHLAVVTTCRPGTAFDLQKCACVAAASHPSCLTMTCQSGFHCEQKGINGGSIPACVRDDAADCRTKGCGTGKTCSPCWGTFACIPKGALC